jgi:dolichol-phosphate mannosyltransferase
MWSRAARTTERVAKQAAKVSSPPEMVERCLVVVPTLNEADNLERLVRAVLETMPQADVLIVDDASTDGTAEIADELSRGEARVHVIHRSSKRGIGAAYVAGLGWGLARGYDYLFEMDADFSHDPRYLPSFLQALAQGADVVVGSRNVAGGAIVGWGLLRYLLSKGGSLYARSILGVDVRDLTTGFKGYTRYAVDRLALGEVESNGYAFQIETTYRALRCGLRVVELPIVFVDRRAGESKMTRAEVLEAVVAVWRMRRSR